MSSTVDLPSALNFSAGPSTLPDVVKTNLIKELRKPITLFERSHKENDIQKIWELATRKLRSLLGIPDRFTILLLPGGARLQISAGLMHLAIGCKLGCLMTGYWGRWAIREAERLNHKLTVLPCVEKSWNDRELSALYYCDNETLAGTQFRVNDRGLLQCIMVDMTSSLLCQPIDFKNVDVIIAGCQKNLGLPGCSLVIADLQTLNPHPLCPPALNFMMQAQSGCHETTPSVLHTWLVLEHLNWLETIGLEQLWKKRLHMADQLYLFFDQSQVFYNSIAYERRSTINITFQLKLLYRDRAADFERQLNNYGLYYLKAHKNFSDGYRINLYNAVMDLDIDRLLHFLINFEKTIYEKN